MLEVLTHILLVMSVILNIILLWMIWKNPDNKQRMNTNFLLTNLGVVNIVSTALALVQLLTKFHCKVGVIILSIILPKYYPSVFFLTLYQYAIIVVPLKFKSLDPHKIKTTKIFLSIHWIVTTVVLIITPIFYHDFEKYVKVIVMVIVCMSWIATAGISYMYVRILHTLWKRQNDLKHKFNASHTQQGIIVIHQNKRLAKKLFLFIVTLVLFSLPSNTAYVFILYCPKCNQRILAKICLYTLPLFTALPVLHPVYWLIVTPSYYKELKRQARKVAVFIDCSKEN